VAAQLDKPAILVESRPGGYQTPEAVDACSNMLFQVMSYVGVLKTWTPPQPDTRGPTIFLRGGPGEALRATKAGYCAIRRFSGEHISAGQAIAEVRSMETFEIIESLVAPFDGGVDSVAEFANWPFITPGDLAGGVKPMQPARL